MVVVYILQNKKNLLEHRHTFTKNVSDNLQSEDWILVAKVYGWNASVIYINKGDVNEIQS
jgi:hypothetical protein